mgnify:CR=1 FL=1
MVAQFYPSVPLESIPRQKMKNGGAFSSGAYIAGQPWSVKIDRVGDLLGASLSLAGAVDNGASAGTPSARVRNPGQLLGSVVKLTVNGKEEFSGHPDLLLARAQWRRGRSVQLQSTKLSSTDLGTNSLVLDFAEQLPFDFVLGAQGVPYHPGVLYGADTPDIELSGTWGTVSDLMTSPGTQSIQSASLTLFKDMARMKRGAGGGLSPQQAAVGFGHFRITQPGGADVTSTGNASWSKDIPGGRAYAGIYLRATAGSAPDASDAPISTPGGFIRIKRGSDIIFEQSLAEAINDTSQGMPTSFDRTGLICVDMLKAYMPGEPAVLSRVLLSPNGQPLTIEVDATTSTNAHIDVLTEEYLDPVSSAAQRYGR